ncbi:MAG: hypothetical protein OXR68_05005, partial [Alphaproteobacteria bacterium]|nr:hypothetical protein [Alphaproteobacteria bacterium]
GALEGEQNYCQLIENELNSLIQKGFETQAFFAPKDELEKLCHFVLPNMPEDKPTRVVVVWGEKGIPCGGTHVQNISELGEVKIRKVKSKKGSIKVSYELC